MPMTWCHTHNVEEHVSDGTYRVCTECGHVYDHEREVLETHNDLMAEAVDEDEAFLPVDEVTDVTTCPMCGAEW